VTSKIDPQESFKSFAVAISDPAALLRWQIVDAKHIKGTRFTGRTYPRTK